MKHELIWSWLKSLWSTFTPESHPLPNTFCSLPWVRLIRKCSKIIISNWAFCFFPAVGKRCLPSNLWKKCRELAGSGDTKSSLRLVQNEVWWKSDWSGQTSSWGMSLDKESNTLLFCPGKSSQVRQITASLEVPGLTSRFISTSI